jgi:hypothetical protein
LLRKYMIRWLLQPSQSKLKDGIDSVAARREFKTVTCKIISPALCETIQRDYMCRFSIANKVVDRFFTPKEEHNIRHISFTYKKTVEHSLLPILEPKRQASIMALVK